MFSKVFVFSRMIIIVYSNNMKPLSFPLHLNIIDLFIFLIRI